MIKWKSSVKTAAKGCMKRTLSRFGYFLGRYPNAYTLETHLADLFRKLDINVVLDVGAHQGEFGEELRLLGYQGHIISFEPVPDNFAILEKTRAGDTKWHAHPYALGAENTTAEINVLSGSTFTSFLSPNEFGREHFGSKMNVERTITVEIKRLDNILEECLAGLTPDPHVFLKMDTQGFDLEVLKGATTELHRIRGLQTELCVQPIYEKMATGFADALPALNGYGFQVTGLYPVTRDPRDQLTVVEFDCVMCRV